MAEKVVSRRVLTKGVAWAAPITVIGTAAPALAASRVNGLNGWVLLRGKCPTKKEGGRLEIDGRGTYPDRGLWVWPVSSADVEVKNAKITFYLPTDRVSGNFRVEVASQWSTPVVDNSVPSKPGYRAYTTTYGGSWTYVSSENQMRVTSFPFFSIATSNICTQPLPVTARRSVDVGGNTLVFDRSVVLGGTSSYSAGIGDDSAEETQSEVTELTGAI